MIKRAPLELPSEVARRFFEDMRAFHREIRSRPMRSPLASLTPSGDIFGRAIGN
jgi:hypothetical protein